VQGTAIAAEHDPQGGRRRQGSVVEIELFAGGGAHALGSPWRVPDDFDVGAIAVGQAEEPLFDFVGDEIAHRTSAGGQGHADVDDIAAERNLVDEAEVNDVDRDFRVETFGEHFVDFGFGKHRKRAGREQTGALQFLTAPRREYYINN